MQRLDRAFNLELNKWHRLGVSLKYSRNKADVYGYCVEYLFNLIERANVEADDIRDRLAEFRPGEGECTGQHYFNKEGDEIVLADEGVKNVSSGNTLSWKEIDSLYFRLRARIVKKLLLDSGPSVFGLFDFNVRKDSLE